MASEFEKTLEAERTKVGCTAVFAGRNVEKDAGAILASLESIITATLLTLAKGDGRAAAGILNDALSLGVDQRIALVMENERKKAAQK